MSATPELSIVIPSFNEELRLPVSLERIAEYVRDRRPNTEVLVVDDGSTDRTAAVAESWRDRIPQLRIISNGVNRGKGFSVKRGSLEAKGEIVLFTDAFCGSRSSTRSADSRPSGGKDAESFSSNRPSSASVLTRNCFTWRDITV